MSAPRHAPTSSFVLALAVCAFIVGCSGERTPEIRVLLRRDIGPGEVNLRDMTRNFLTEYPHVRVTTEFADRDDISHRVERDDITRFSVVAEAMPRKRSR